MVSFKYVENISILHVYSEKEKCSFCELFCLWKEWHLVGSVSSQSKLAHKKPINPWPFFGCSTLTLVLGCLAAVITFWLFREWLASSKVLTSLKWKGPHKMVVNLNIGTTVNRYHTIINCFVMQHVHSVQKYPQTVSWDWKNEARSAEVKYRLFVILLYWGH